MATPYRDEQGALREGFTRVVYHVRKFANPPAEAWSWLGEQSERLLIEENRSKVLSGRDRYDTPAPALKYRGAAPTKRVYYRKAGTGGLGKAGGFGERYRRELRGFSDYTGGATSTVRVNRYQPGPSNPYVGRERVGVIPFARRMGERQPAILRNNNLATWMYKTLDGPRLAPRREASRSIVNFRTEPRFEPAERRLTVAGMWVDVVDVNGEPFLHNHFDGTQTLPPYDLRGIREVARNRIRRELIPGFNRRVREAGGR